MLRDSYEALKKQIYQLEKQQAGLRESYHDLEANEHTSLIGSSHPSSPDALFIPALDRELEKINLFYVTEEQRLEDDVSALQDEIERQEESGPYAGHQYLNGDEDDDEHSVVRSASRVEVRQPSLEPRRPID